jgi:hypothetical protein
MFLSQLTKAVTTDKQICNSHKQAKILKRARINLRERE